MVYVCSSFFSVMDDRACRDKVGHAIRDAATTTESRRQKKQKKQSIPTNDMFSSRGPISRYAEMKMDTPEPVSFHDVVHSSFVGRPGAFPTNSRPLGIQYSGLGATTMPAVAAMGRSFSAPREQDNAQGGLNNESVANSPPDEAVFMEQINEVLGPMPPDHDVDPLADLLNLS